MTIDITGLDKPTILAALYNAAEPRGLGVLNYSPEPMTRAQAVELLTERTRFEYVSGRPIKVAFEVDTLHGDEHYDRDQGVGRCARVIDRVRNGLTFPEPVAVDFLPSELMVLSPLPFTGALGRVEREVAAAVIVRTCALLGDKWQGVTPRLMGEVLLLDIAKGAKDFAKIVANPIAPPDFIDLVRAGYATCALGKGDPLMLTASAMTALERFRRPRPNPGSEAVAPASAP